ncbi:hypothetical protein [Roseospira goensis]|uniref:Uncharacterized protein n=1 Tax=Roseospira goensis TaxID=391922 RepID=A0A7W6S118_9PROT|nr:hypothetical protein [Roseospira goensis]MBB4286894.1 hypothetical protein [Roseospira goensis]
MTPLAWMGATTPVDVVRSGRDGAARRTLSAGVPAAEGGAFRRFDLATSAGPGVDPRSPTADPTRPRPDRRPEDDAPGALRQRRPAAAEAGPEDRPAGAGTESAVARAAGEAPRETEPQGLLRPLTAGRTALLAGALGVLAQLVGQSAAPPQAATATAGPAAAPLPAGGAGTADQAETVGPSVIQTRAGLRTYEAANRAVGAAAGPAVSADGREILIGAPAPARTPLLDAVA